jgi:hypothetical protein
MAGGSARSAGQNQGGGQLPHGDRLALDVGVGVAASVEADRGVERAVAAVPVVVAVVGGTRWDDDPEADGGIRSRGIMGLSPDVVGVGCCEHPVLVGGRGRPGFLQPVCRPLRSSVTGDIPPFC